MPPKAKPSSKAKEADFKTKEPEFPPPKTLHERTAQRYYQTNPCEKRREEAGLHALSPAERQTWVNATFLPRVASKDVYFSNKVDREFWKQVARDSLPLRSLTRDQKRHDWGRDRLGRDIGELSPENFEQRSLRQARLSCLEALHSSFLQRRDAARQGLKRHDGSPIQVSPEEIEEDKKRRTEMATLKKELYGENMGPYAQDPEWDDVVPIPAEEPEGALAAIAYPDDYAEAISYLRAAMAAEEYSPRTLRLTGHVISMNPAHYTVWLFRFKIVQALELELPQEIVWLNYVSLQHLKNYQIWHHRQLLLDHYYPTILATDPTEAQHLARGEAAFLREMLEEDAKNYHVWSYRQYLVRKLNLWTPHELMSTQTHIEDDVRNNSAWSHRFFLVFSEPGVSTDGSHSTEHDPAVPAEIVDRELRYAQEKTVIVPQNQASWNYLRGVLVKGGRPLASCEEFAAQFVKNVGDGEGEEVQSSHALDFLADVFAEKGEKDKAATYLSRLAEKWDPIRAGYWNYRKQQLTAA